jgi:hypothetical protein
MIPKTIIIISDFVRSALDYTIDIRHLANYGALI